MIKVHFAQFIAEYFFRCFPLNILEFYAVQFLVSSVVDEEAAFDDIASGFVERIRHDWLYVMGPGTTTRAISRRLGLEKTLLGVDLILQQELVGVDVTEVEIVKAIKGEKLKVQAAIQGEELRVSGKKRDDLQKVIDLIKGLKIDQPLQYVNFRD